MSHPDYIPITDWTVAGRASFYAEHQWTVQDLLDHSFTQFIDDGGSLATYGFRSEDRITEAVEFCVERFTTGALDGNKIRAEDRSTRLFTRVPFWLVQKVGRKAYRARQHRRLEPVWSDSWSETVPDNRLLADLRRSSELGVVAGTMGRTLGELQAKTCSALVGAWLRGSERWRGPLMGDLNVGSDRTESGAATLSRVQADALLRFLVLGAMLAAGLDANAARVIETSWFDRAEDASHYRRPDAEVARRLELPGSRWASQQRKSATEQLVRAGMQLAAESNTADLWRWVAQNSLWVSVCDAHGLEGDAYKALRTALKELRRSQGAA